MWEELFSWTVVGILVPVIIGIGGLAMSIPTPQLQLAKFCFTIAALILIVRVGIWIISVQSPIVERVIITFLLIGTISTICIESLRWVDGIKQATAKTPDATGSTIIEPLISANLRLASQEKSKSTHPDFPYGLHAVLQTTTTIEPVAILVTCDGDIGSGVAGVGTGMYMVSPHEGVVKKYPNLFIIAFTSPPFTPRVSMDINFFSKKPIKIIKVEEIPWAALSRLSGKNEHDVPPKEDSMVIFTQKQINPIGADAKKYTQEIIINTNAVIQAPVALLITHDSDLAGGYNVEFVSKHLISYKGLYNNQPGTLVIAWASPSFIPQEPIVVKLYSSKPAKVLKVEKIAYNLVK